MYFYKSVISETQVWLMVQSDSVAKQTSYHPFLYPFDQCIKTDSCSDNDKSIQPPPSLSVMGHCVESLRHFYLWALLLDRQIWLLSGRSPAIPLQLWRDSIRTEKSENEREAGWSEVMWRSHVCAILLQSLKLIDQLASFLPSKPAE